MFLLLFVCILIIINFHFLLIFFSHQVEKICKYLNSIENIDTDDIESEIYIYKQERLNRKKQEEDDKDVSKVIIIIIAIISIRLGISLTKYIRYEAYYYHVHFPHPKVVFFILSFIHVLNF